MHNDTKESRLRSKLAKLPGVRRVRRPITPDGQRGFDLSYVRAGPTGGPTLLVIPGGPGMASVLPYRRLRKDAAARGMDVVMVEHRGVGLSRLDDDGEDLPTEAFTVNQVVDDLAAVLDDCGVAKAVVYGCSYGGQLAQGLGIRRPDRIAAMVLDSGGSLTADDELIVREHLRGLLWHGRQSRTEAVARKLRGLVDDGLVPVRETGTAVPIVYEFGGVELLDRFYGQLRAGRGGRTWRWLIGLADREIGQRHPFVLESDLVDVLTYRELVRHPEPDGLPLDPGLGFTDKAGDYPPFEGEPYDLPAELPGFVWPCAVISGERDLRTPRVIAEQITELLPDGVLVPLAGMGHSALDTHRVAALHVTHAVAERAHRKLPELADRIAELPRRGASGMLGPLISARLTAERLLPV